MCGIVGYTGPREAYPILLKGLKRLEYRGYDSSGVALLNSNGLNVYKKKGKVAEMEEDVMGKNTHAHIGIGHTRWATHGEPSDRNAHPHLSQSGQLAMIHNGIIEVVDDPDAYTSVVMYRVTYIPVFLHDPCEKCGDPDCRGWCDEELQ